MRRRWFSSGTTFKIDGAMSAFISWFFSQWSFLNALVILWIHARSFLNTWLKVMVQGFGYGGTISRAGLDGGTMNLTLTNPSPEM